MFLDFIFIFVVGWLFTNFTNIAVLFLNKPKYLNYVCRKCFTFWFGFIFLLISTQDVKYSIAVAGISSFITFIIEEKLDV